MLAKLKAGATRSGYYYVKVDGCEYPAFLENGRQYFHSPRSQCLPCEVVATNAAADGVSVASYITGLHPRHSATVYRNLESLISLVLDPRNECLMKGHSLPNNRIRTNFARSGHPQSGRIPARVTSFGRDWINDLPLIALSFNKDYPEKALKSRDWGEEYPRDTDLIRVKAKVPKSPTPAVWRWAEEYLLRSEDCADQSCSNVLPDNWKDFAWHHIAAKALQSPTLGNLRAHGTTNPGSALAYEDWRAGQVSDPWMTPMYTMPLNCHRAKLPEEKLPGPYFQGPILNGIDSIRIQDDFQKRGLQIFVRIAGIELAQDKPQHDPCQWSLQGTLNEHIVATAIVVLDIDNVSPCFVELRQETSKPREDYDSEYTTIPSMRCEPVEDVLECQGIGKVELRSGRLIAFPNTMEHRIGACHLIDPSRCGHARFIHLDLLDPHYRICSTRNVPAQQREWWEEEVTQILLARLPAELCELIVQRRQDIRVSREEAEEDRNTVLEGLELMHRAKYLHVDGIWALSIDELSGPPS